MSDILPNHRPTVETSRARAFSNIGSHTMIAAQVSKLRKGNMPHHQPGSISNITGALSQAEMLGMSREQQIRTIDNENALQVMPEIEWACRLLIASLRSPKDMTKGDLIYSIDIPWLPPTIRSSILDEIKKDIELIYDYSDSLSIIFKDALFTKGSHVRLILPEAAVDQIINSGHELSMEHLNTVFNKEGTSLRGSGYFGPRKLGKSSRSLTMESFQRAGGYSQGSADIDEGEDVYIKFSERGADGKIEESEFILPELTITDNSSAVKLPFYIDSIASSRRGELCGRPQIDVTGFDFSGDVTLESFSKAPSGTSKLTENEFRNLVYKGAPTNMVTHLRIPGRDQLKRRSVGRPLVMSIPPEAVVPLHVPGDVRRKIGAIILYENGHPISIESADQVIARAQSLYTNMSSSTSMGNNNTGSTLLARAARNLSGTTQVTPFNELPKIFEQLMDENIVPRLMNGAYPGGVEIGHNNDLYMLMVSRILCSMHTKMVFVPAEMLTYFAFDYHSNGMGKSLLDVNKTLISLRAGLLLTRATSEMRNSIPLTKVTMKIDERDSDWEKTLEETNEILTQTRQPQYPLNNLNVNDMMDWIHRAGFFFAFEGHPRIPDTGFTFDKVNHDIPLPDTEFYDQLGRQLYLGLGIPPELMDSANDPEFAIAIASRNIMFSRTILELQKIASGLISDDHVRLILSDGVLMNKIVGLIRGKWGEITSKLPEEDKIGLKSDPTKFAISLVKRIVESIVVTLPSPDMSTIENQSEAFTQYEEFVDKALPYIVSDNIISSDIAPELSQKISSMEPMIKSALMREYLANNNILPELFEISSTDEEGKPMFDLLKIMESYSMGLAANLMSAAAAMMPIEAAVKKDSEALNLSDEGGGSDFGGGGDSGGGDFGGDDFGGGGDDFGGDDSGGDSGGELDISMDMTDDEGGEEPPAE